MSYLEFLKKKIPLAQFDGYHVDLSEINQLLSGHQQACVQWAVKGGNRALFEAFGLGKTAQQVEVVRLMQKCADYEERK